MSAESKVQLYVTHVDHIGPYLRLSGQLNRDAVNVIHSRIQQLLPTFFEIASTWGVEHQQALLQRGTYCVYKRQIGAAIGDCEYVRARVLNATLDSSQRQQTPLSMRVQVEFVDFGQTKTLDSRELLFPKQPPLLTNIPVLCKSYIVLGICAEWTQEELREVAGLINTSTIDIVIKHDKFQQKFISAIWKDFDLAEFLMQQKKIGAPIEHNLQIDHVQKMFKDDATKVSLANKSPNILNNNNNNPHNSFIFNNNNHINNGQSAIKTATDIAREELMARRSLAARLEKHRLPQQQQQPPPQQQQQPQQQITDTGYIAMPRMLAVSQDVNESNPILVPTFAPRIPQTLGCLHSMVKGISAENSRLPLTGLNCQLPSRPALPINSFGIGLQPSPMDVYYSRYKPPQPQPQQQQSVQALARPFYGPMMPARPPQARLLALSVGTSRASFKPNNLVIGQTYDVTVCFVENGPYAFSVQLRNDDRELTDMMTRLENVRLQSLNEVPFVGMPCLARFSDDNHVYRALINGVFQASCRVLYIDYGNSETVTYRDLYIIPSDFLEAKPFAMRFMLSGSKQLEPIDGSLKKAFKNLVLFNHFKLTVMPLEGPPLVQYCKLLREGVNIINLLRDIKQSRLIYPKAEPLKDNDMVEIRYIDSPRHFYVQKQENIKDFEQLMDAMFEYYNINQVVPNELCLGAPCMVKCDNEWFRAEVMRADSKAIVVRHVDFGYEQRVTKNLISTIAESHVKMPRQAVQCCLKGFENNELNKSVATDQFEMLAEVSNLRQRRLFSVRVFRIQPDGMNVVNLVSKNLNVMKKLFKLCMPFEQYLTLEKEEFNTYSTGIVFGSVGASSNHSKSPSIASSSEGVSSAIPMNKKIALSSTASQQSDERPQQQSRSPQQQQLRNRSNNGSIKSDWDKQSSASSNTRDTRSNSSEQLQQQQQQQQQHHHPRQQTIGKRQYQQQQQQQEQQPTQQQPHLKPIGRAAPQYDSSFDSRSNGSITSGLSSISKYSSSNSNGNRKRNGEMPPRFQNGKQEALNNTRLNRQPQSARKQPVGQLQQSPQQQQRNQRPQNAPQGFSQKPQRQKSTLTAATLSKKPSGTTDNASTTSETSSINTQPQPEVYMPLDHAFPIEDIQVPIPEEEITISWWISPHQFYIQRKSRAAKYEQMVREMQNFYKQKPHQQLQLKVGSHIVARYRKDNVIQRARVLACNQMLRKYKVYFVDIGNQYTVTSEDIWQVEERFIKVPCMAYRGSFEGIVSNYDHLYIVDRMDKHLPTGSNIKCEFIKRNKDIYYVDVLVNGARLKDTLINVGFVTPVAKEINIALLVGQQIRAKVTATRDMLNFKIQVECFNEKLELLSSFDDVRYVKSNPDVARKFKGFYEDKSCIFNVKDVNENNVILLRPMMPLLKDDIPMNICTYPVLLEHFQARVVYVHTPYRFYAQPVSVKQEIDKLLHEMRKYYKSNGKPLEKLEQDQVCAALSNDGNWYRARLTSSAKAESELIEIFYIDFGNTEKLEKSKLKSLETQFYLNKCAYGIEVNLPVGRTTNSESVLRKIDEVLVEKLVIIKPIEVRRNHLIANVKLAEKKQCLIDLLKSKQLLKSRDIEYMRKQLDKEKPNMLEYIETVDLTLEDEDEEKKGKKSATSSPKRKKQTKTTQGKSITVDEKLTAVEKPAATAPAESTTTSTTAITLPPVACVKVNEEVTNAKQQTTRTPAAVLAAKEATVDKIAAEKETKMPKQAATTGVETAEKKSKAKSPTHTPPLDAYADMETAVLSHCDNPGQFYVHPQNKLEHLLKLQENLQIVSSSLPQLMNVSKGSECISLYSVDKQWYRAKILDAELMVLQFIDFGNTDCVSDTTDVKESMWAHLPPYCLPCALPIRPNGTADWVDAANAIFNDSYTKLLHYEYITRGDHVKRSYINLFIEGINVAEKLINDGYAKPLKVVKSGENCFISHVNGITDFYIQFEKDSKALELIEIYLHEATMHLEPLQQFEKMLIVAARFAEDQLWYRAELLREVPGQGYEVRFIDYGNTAISAECRLVSDQIANVPALSQKCELELSPNYVAWSDEAEAKFGEIAATGETIFTVELRQPAVDRVIVHLLIDEHNINDDLVLLCAEQECVSSYNTSINSQNTSLLAAPSVHENGSQMDAVVTHVNSPLDFYVQFDKDSARVEHMANSLHSLHLEPIDKPTSEEPANKLYAARYEEDNSLYRARILSHDAAEQQWHVLFVDFGNECTVSEIFELPQDLQQLRPLVRHCRLEPSPRFTKLPLVSNETFNALLESCAFGVKLEYVDGDSVPASVKLYSNDAKALNICKQLHQLLDNAKTNASTTAAAVAAEQQVQATHKQCLISHANAPTSFYIQLKTHCADLELIRDALEKSKALKLPAIDDVTENMACVCYSTEDDCYNRGKVTAILNDDKGWEVLLIDFGMVITTKDLRQLPAEIAQFPPLAVHCTLDGMPTDVDAAKLEEAFATLLELHFGEVYEIVASTPDTKTGKQQVQLQIDYKDLTQELKNSVAGIVPSPLPTLYNCTVVKYNAPISFYLQFEEDIPALERVTDKLLDANTQYAIFDDLKVGTICAAQFPDDSVYYRAEIMQVLADGKCEVHFIDFGNNAVTDQFRALPEDMVNLQRFSKHCQLDGVTIGKWDVAQLQAFFDSRCSESFQAELLTTQEPCVTRLFYQGKSLAEQQTQLDANPLNSSTTSKSSSCNE